MKIAAIYDIHGNLPALEAVLNDAERSGVDQNVVGGDVILGPCLVSVWTSCCRLKFLFNLSKEIVRWLPFGKPGAYWLHLDSKAGFRYVNYDIEKAVDRIKKN
ncbi:MAG: hypothetical protein K8H85_05285 [Cyclobacteriaceae bacterium]|nr:hypothetical protein [Cyclobacteriaceae bacterium]